MPLHLTFHSEKRIRQRGLRERDVAAVLPHVRKEALRGGAR